MPNIKTLVEWDARDTAALSVCMTEPQHMSRSFDSLIADLENYHRHGNRVVVFPPEAIWWRDGLRIELEIKDRPMTTETGEAGRRDIWLLGINLVYLWAEIYMADEFAEGTPRGALLGEGVTEDRLMDSTGIRADILERMSETPRFKIFIVALLTDATTTTAAARAALRKAVGTNTFGLAWKKAAADTKAMHLIPASEIPAYSGDLYDFLTERKITWLVRVDRVGDDLAFGINDNMVRAANDEWKLGLTCGMTYIIEICAAKTSIMLEDADGARLWDHPCTCEDGAVIYSVACSGNARMVDQDGRIISVEFLDAPAPASKEESIVKPLPEETGFPDIPPNYLAPAAIPLLDEEEEEERTAPPSSANFLELCKTSSTTSCVVDINKKVVFAYGDNDKRARIFSMTKSITGFLIAHDMLYAPEGSQIPMFNNVSAVMFGDASLAEDDAWSALRLKIDGVELNELCTQTSNLVTQEYGGDDFAAMWFNPQLNFEVWVNDRVVGANRTQHQTHDFSYDNVATQIAGMLFETHKRRRGASEEYLLADDILARFFENQDAACFVDGGLGMHKYTGAYTGIQATRDALLHMARTMLYTPEYRRVLEVIQEWAAAADVPYAHRADWRYSFLFWIPKLYDRRIVCMIGFLGQYVVFDLDRDVIGIRQHAVEFEDLINQKDQCPRFVEEVIAFADTFE